MLLAGKNYRVYFLSAFFLFACSSCYYYDQAVGHLELTWKKKAIEEAVKEIEDERKKQLLLEVPRIKKFAFDVIKLHPSSSYSDYYTIKKQAITFNVTASPKLELTPYKWRFPFLGEFTYKGYYKKEDALEEARRLAQQDYDIWIFSSTAYSTLGWFDDPVNNFMLDGDIYDLANILFHELTHETLFIKNKTDFNEQLASFVGKKGAELYLKAHYADAQAILNNKKKAKIKGANYRTLMHNSYLKAEAIYQQERTDSKKRELKKALFEQTALKIAALYPQSSKQFRTINNARLLQFQRYAPDNHLILDLWHEANEDWTLFWELVRKRYDS